MTHKPMPRKRDNNKRPDRDQSPPPAGQRIAKLMARAGLASRREAEAWISGTATNGFGKAH
jgi:23S rRNA pseudouridine2605 synthase